MDEHAADYDALLRLAQHLSSRDMDHWFRPRCELAGNNNLARCSGDAVGTRWEDGFADLVCEEHAANAEARGALVARARRHDGTNRVIPPVRGD